MSWSNTFSISWVMTEPPSEAYVSGEDYRPDLEKTQEVMNKKVPIKKGDEITVLYIEGEPFFVTRYDKKGNTVKDVLESLYDALDEPLFPDIHDVKGIYKRISQWFSGETRLDLVRKYESGHLKPKDLLGEHKYFEGMGRTGKTKNIWVATGS